MSLMQDIRNALEGVRGREDTFTAKCPAHDDQSASLSVTLPRDTGDPDGIIELKCFAQCKREDIVAALKAKGVVFARKREPVPDRGGPQTRTLRFDVRDANGILIAYKERREELRGGLWKAAKGEQRWFRPDGTPGLGKRGEPGAISTESLLYRCETLRDNPESIVIITEGERKADDLAKIGVTCAIGLVGGASNPPSARALRVLEGREVFLWPDNDAPGEALMATVRDRLLSIADSVVILEWADAPPKGDASDFVAKGLGREALGALIREARSKAVPAPRWSVPFSVAIKKAFEDLDRRASRIPLDAARCGIESLDRALGGGFRPGEVYLLGAPTGGGKTTLLQSFAINAASGTDDPDTSKRVLLVTPEMSLMEMGRRAVAREVGGLDDVWGKPDLVMSYTERAGRLAGLPIIMADKSDITIAEVFAEARRLSREPEGLGLVLVDYAQHVVDEEDARRPRYLAVGDVMSGCIDLAKKIGVPVVLASQVNRSSDDEGRVEYTFRESAKLEHGASVVLIFDREKPYDANTATPEAEVEIEAKILCKKNRLGIQFGKLPVFWNKAAFFVSENRTAEPTEPPETNIVVAGTPPPQLPAPQGDTRSFDWPSE